MEEHDVVTGSRNTFYSALVRSVPNRCWRFMNHGYSSSDADFDHAEDFANAERYNIALLNKLVRKDDVRGKDVLEIGCGRGGNAYYLKTYRSPRSMTAVDINEENILFCNSSYGSIAFRVADACDLPFDGEVADIVMNIESSHCYSDVGRFFSEVKRVLRPGGLFIYADAVSAQDSRLRFEQISGSGMTVIEFEDITAPVTAALVENKAEMTKFFLSLQDSQRANRRLLEDLVDTLGRRAPLNYTNGQVSYLCWRLLRT